MLKAVESGEGVPLPTGRGLGEACLLACKNCVMRCWCDYLSGAKCKGFAYVPSDATATLSSLASLQSRMVLPFGADLPWLSWRPFKGCSSYMALIDKHILFYRF